METCFVCRDSAEGDELMKCNGSAANCQMRVHASCRDKSQYITMKRLYCFCTEGTSGTDHTAGPRRGPLWGAYGGNRAHFGGLVRRSSATGEAILCSLGLVMLNIDWSFTGQLPFNILILYVVASYCPRPLSWILTGIVVLFAIGMVLMFIPGVRHLIVEKIGKESQLSNIELAIMTLVSALYGRVPLGAVIGMLGDTNNELQGDDD